MKSLFLAFALFSLAACTPFEQELMVAQVELTTVVNNMNKLQNQQYVRGDQPADMILETRKMLEHVTKVLKNAPKVQNIKEQYRPIYLEVEKQSIEFLKFSHKITALIPQWRNEQLVKELPLLNKAFTSFISVAGKREGYLFGLGSKIIELKIDTQLYDTAPACASVFSKYGPWSWIESSTSCTSYDMGDGNSYQSCSTSDTTEYCYPPDCDHQLDLKCFEQESRHIDVTSKNFYERDCQVPFLKVLKKCHSSQSVFK